MSLQRLSAELPTPSLGLVMALSSGGWAPPATVPASSQQAACGGPIPTACCSTVLMSVRVSVCHSGIRPLCLPGAGSEALRLQLSMDPSRAGEFRLALRDMSGNRSVVRLDMNSLFWTVAFSIPAFKCVITAQLHCNITHHVIDQHHPARQFISWPRFPCLSRRIKVHFMMKRWFLIFCFRLLSKPQVSGITTALGEILEMGTVSRNMEKIR